MPPLYNPKTNIAHAILKALVNYAPKIAQISDDTGVQLTFDEIRLKTIRAAQNLQKRGDATKQVFSFVANNSQYLTPMVFASMCLGCPIGWIDTMDASFGKAELIHMLKTTKPRLIFCDIEVYDATKESLDELGNNAQIFTFGGCKGGSEPVENLFEETGNEDEFM